MHFAGFLFWNILEFEYFCIDIQFFCFFYFFTRTTNQYFILFKCTFILLALRCLVFIPGSIFCFWKMHQPFSIVFLKCSDFFKEERSSCVLKNSLLTFIFSLTNTQTSRAEVFCKKGAKLTGKHLSLFISFNKIIRNFIQKRLQRGWFPVNIVKFLRTAFL